MLKGRPTEEWIAQYSKSHQHPANRFLHTYGIPMIVISLALFVASIFAHLLLPYAVGFFLFGWILQFAGHAFERKAPEFFHDWRFLLIGTRWWWLRCEGRLRKWRDKSAAGTKYLPANRRHPCRSGRRLFNA